MYICMYKHIYTYVHMYTHTHLDRKKPLPPGGFPIYYVPSSRAVRKRTPLEAPGTHFSRGILLYNVLTGYTLYMAQCIVHGISRGGSSYARFLMREHSK